MILQRFLECLFHDVSKLGAVNLDNARNLPSILQLFPSILQLLPGDIFGDTCLAGESDSVGQSGRRKLVVSREGPHSWPAVSHNDLALKSDHCRLLRITRMVLRQIREVPQGVTHTIHPPSPPTATGTPPDRIVVKPF